MYWKRTVAPTEEPVTLEEAKDHLRVDHSYEDAIIDRHIRAARRLAEETYLRRSLITQTWQLFLDEYPSSNRASIHLPRGPVQSVSSVTSIDDDDAETTFASTEWYLVDDDNEPRIVLRDDAEWPSLTLRPENGVRVQYVAGYGDDRHDVPEEIRDWLLLKIGDLYEHRETAVVGTMTGTHDFADALVSGYRDWREFD